MDPLQRAVLAVVDGAEEELAALLASYPDLPLRRTDDAFEATLLHHVAANGVPDELQRTPANAAAICRMLLAGGSDPDALGAAYGGGPNATTLCLLVSSWPPFEAGVQADLVRALVQGGARADGLLDDGAPLATALVFGYTGAAEALVAAGARVDNVFFAAGLGDERRLVELLESESPLGSYVPPIARTADHATPVQEAFHFAVTHGREGTAALLLERGADVNGRTTGHHTELPLVQARFVREEAMARWLLERGADPDLVCRKTGRSGRG